MPGTHSHLASLPDPRPLSRAHYPNSFHFSRLDDMFLGAKTKDKERSTAGMDPSEL